MSQKWGTKMLLGGKRSQNFYEIKCYNSKIEGQKSYESKNGGQKCYEVKNRSQKYYESRSEGQK